MTSCSIPHRNIEERQQPLKTRPKFWSCQHFNMHLLGLKLIADSTWIMKALSKLVIAINIYIGHGISSSVGEAMECQTTNILSRCRRGETYLLNKNVILKHVTESGSMICTPSPHMQQNLRKAD